MTWRKAAVSACTAWADDLWTLRLDVDLGPFAPGQFVNVGLHIDGELVKRSYSLASAPGAPAEIYLVRVDGGKLTPRLFDLGLGDELEVDDAPKGFFTLDYVPDANVLWLLSTGTGLGPFMSMLRSGVLWDRFDEVVVVHGARVEAHLGYRDELEALSAVRPVTYVPMVTREHLEEVLHGRIPAAIDNGVLEKAAGCAFDERAHVMICGNPAMIQDTTTVLEAKGLRKHRQRKPGHISTEKYW